MKTAICAIIKNEQEYLKEWIDWNLKLGFSQIYLYEDYDSDSHNDIVKDYECVHLLQLEKFGIEFENNIRQRKLYNKFIDVYKHDFDWIAFIDADEFICIDDNVSLNDFLSEYSDCPAVFLAWKTYNASYHIDKPKGNVMDNYVTTVKMENVSLMWQIKSIVNTKHGSYMVNDHYASAGVNVLKNRDLDNLVYEKAHINHYFTKSFEDWKNRILIRGNVFKNNRTLSQFFDDFNPELLHLKKELICISEKEKNIQRIPKIIHNCWLNPNNEKTRLIAKCMSSQKKILKDYEFKMWNMNTFNVYKHPFVLKAIENEMWAFASDYIRIWALYNYGGIYLDCDVEVLKQFDDLLHLPYAMCIQDNRAKDIESAVMMFEPKHPLLKKLLDYYDSIEFKMNRDELVLPTLMKNFLKSNYLIEYIKDPDSFVTVDDRIVNILPKRYFTPMDYRTRKIIYEPMYCIHHYNYSWSKFFNKHKK